MSGTPRYFSLRFGRDAATHQSAIMQLLKSQGHDCIQTSDGLCVKAQVDQKELESMLEEKEFLSGVLVEPIQSSEDQSKDVQVFMGQK